MMPPKDLNFVVTTNPYDASQQANKRKVRSLAATMSWPGRRKRTFDQFEQGRTTPTEATVEGAASGTGNVQGRRRAAGSKAAAGAKGDGSEGSGRKRKAVQSTAPPMLEQTVLPVGVQVGNGLISPISEDGTGIAPESATSATGQYGPQQALAVLQDYKSLALLTPPTSPGPPRTVSDTLDQFNCYPVPYKRWYDHVLHHMDLFCRKGWTALRITDKEGVSWESFMMQHALSEPALFYTRLLFGSGDLISLGILKPEASIYLRMQAVKSINEALADPMRATSDPLILAVGRIALHECLYGDRDAAVVMHRPAQKRMIAMRGGMAALEFPELIKRLMRWADRVMATQSGTERILEDDTESKNYTWKESVNVLETWVPDKGQQLRKKIAISDLVND